MDLVDLIQQDKIKRFFRATRKLTGPGVLSHITQRAAGKEPLFLEDDDYLRMLGLLKKASEKGGLRILAFCLMKNHLHLLARLDKGNLQDQMRDIFSQYAGSFNRKYERKGHLFAGRYRQAVCLDLSYLLAVSLYIHLNPVRAGLVTSPYQYRWSSIKVYLDPDGPKTFVDPDFILGLLADDRIESIKRYQTFLEKSLEFPLDPVLEQPEATEKFRTKLIKKFSKLIKPEVLPQKVARVSSGELVNIEELEERIEWVRKNPPKRPETRAAQRFLIEQLIARGYKRTEIAERLQLSPKTIYTILKNSLPISARSINR